MNLGSIWFILSGVTSVSNDALTKLLGSNINGLSILFFRMFFSFLIIIPFALNKISFNMKILFQNSIRAILLVLGMLPWIYGASNLPLAIITTIGFTTPFTNTLLARIILGEKISSRCVISNIIGFVGIIVMTLDDNLSINMNHLYYIILLLSSTVSFALLDIVNKKMLVQNESIVSMMFYSALLTAILSLIIGMIISYYYYQSEIYIENNILYSLLLLFILGIGANLILFFLLKAFSLSNISQLQPLRYLELVTTLIFSFIFFNEWPSILNIIGSMIILSSTIYLTLSSSKH